MGNGILYGIFSRVVHMSMTAGVIICMVLGIRLFLRRAPRLYCYLLWSVVLFRLLCPAAAASPFSVLRIWESSAVQNPVEAKTQALGKTPVAPGVPSVQDTKGAPSGGAASLPEKGAQADGRKETAFYAAAFIWLLGMACMASYGFISAVRLKRRLQGAVCITENIYISDYIDTPFAMGVLAPKIYLPGYLSETEQEYIVLHEKTHIKRGDPFIKLLAFAALTVHWFNPLVWIAFLASEQDMELSCDETVMRQIKEDIRAKYCMSLLALSAGKGGFRGTPTAFGEGNTKSRVKHIMCYKKPAAYAAGLAAVLVAVCLVGFGTNPGVKKAAGGNEGAYSVTETEEGTEAALKEDSLHKDMAKEDTDTEKAQESGGHSADGMLFSEYEFLGAFGGVRSWMGEQEGEEQVIYSETADVTHDGIEDRIDLLIDTADAVGSAEQYLGGMGLAYIKVYEGRPDGSFCEDALYVSGEVTHAHAGNGQIGLVRKDGQEYLLISHIWEGQGSAEYRFSVFYLDSGQKTAVCADEGAAEFWIGDSEESSGRAEALEEDAVTAFREKLHAWTRDAVLFVSCDLYSDPVICLSEPGNAYPASGFYDKIWER